MIDFKEHRNKYFAQMKDKSIALFSSATEMVRNSDCDFPFRQESGFLYLTGFNEPDAYLALIKNGTSQQAILFNRKKDKSAEIWHGYRVGQEAAVTEFGFDSAYENSEFKQKLPELMDGLDNLYFPIFKDEALTTLLTPIMNALRGGKRRGSISPEQYYDGTPILDNLRLSKSADEIALMATATEISSAGHIRAMQTVEPGMFEYQLEGEITHEFTRKGARHLAYNSIVAGGNNACCLHYSENDSQLKEGDLVLIDAGAEFQGYAGDITRTFPVNGVFLKEQALLYQLVLDIQVTAVSQVKVGAIMNDINKQVIKTLVEGLVKLGLLTGDIETLIKDKAYMAFYMHGIGHYIGLDVHDVGSYGTLIEPRALTEGVVVTIEPGIYISENADVEDKWKGIGIRIEDDVLVTKEGNRVLSADAPKTISDIESLMLKAKKARLNA
jgi:Xaa-Pro aminopeptidase